MKLKLAFVGILILSNIGVASAQDISKYEALFITKFVDYIEWPHGNSAKTIGVIGDKKVYDEILNILTKSGKSHKALNIVNKDEAATCDIVFLADSETKNFEEILSLTKGNNILIISENKTLINRGAGISFFMENSKLKFSINKGAFDAENLKVSNSLLALGQAI